MLKNRITLIAILALITLLSSCAKEGPTGPTGPVGPNYYGTVSGHISLYDKYGSKILTNLDSSYLVLTGVTTPTTAVTYTDANGAYSFPNIYTGNYNLALSHTNFAATQKSNFPFLIGTANVDVKLSAIPDSFLNSFTIVHTAGSAYDSLVIGVTPDPLQRNCIVFVSSNNAVSNNEYVGYLLSYAHVVPANSSTVVIPVSSDELSNAGFVSGTSMVFYAAYSYVVNDASVYEDQATGKNIYNAVNTYPLIDSAIAP